MVQDIVIRAEFLIDDLSKSIINDKGDFHPLIVKAWQEDIRYLISNGMECDTDMVYDFNNKEDLKECIDMGMDAKDIAYLVFQYRDNKDNTHFFYYINTNNMCGWHILSKQDVVNAITKQIEQIAYNVLKYPYKGYYGELYKEFVVPMIESQV